VKSSFRFLANFIAANASPQFRSSWSRLRVASLNDIFKELVHWPETSQSCRLVGRIRETIARKISLEVLQDPLSGMYVRENYSGVLPRCSLREDSFPVNLGRTISQMASRLFQRALTIESDAGVDHFGPPRCSTCCFHPTALTSQSCQSKRQLSCVMWYIAARYRCSTSSLLDIPWKSSCALYILVTWLCNSLTCTFHEKIVRYHRETLEYAAFIPVSDHRRMRGWGGSLSCSFSGLNTRTRNVEKEHGTTCTRHRAPVPEASDSRCTVEYPPPFLDSLRLPLLSKRPNSVPLLAPFHLPIDPRNQWRHPFSCPTFTYLDDLAAQPGT